MPIAELKHHGTEPARLKTATIELWLLCIDHHSVRLLLISVRPCWIFVKVYWAFTRH